MHQKAFFGGPYVPEFIFNKYGPLKLATWSSLLLECSCIFLVWSKNKYIKYGTVFSMIALHLGIESTMNMHVFEILSIVGWCMFLIEPNQSYREYIGGNISKSATGNNDTAKPKSIHETITQYVLGMIQHITFINIFLLTLIPIFIIDTFPLHEIHDILEGGLTVPLSTVLTDTTSRLNSSFASGLSDIVTKAQTILLNLNSSRKDYFFRNVMKFLYPIGLFQDVWNLYTKASDTNCIFTTNITTYSIIQSEGNSTTHQLNSYVYASPDWGTASWYTKKRYQRPMSMDFKYLCRDCYVRYYANSIINDMSSKNGISVSNIQLASAILTGQCENPPPPPAVDDWFNWSGWFYADAKQDVLVQHDPILLYSTNICNDLNVDLCREYLNEGLCHSAKHYHSYRHGFDDGNMLTDDDTFVYNITQTCRRSCNFCPEDGYDTNDLRNGTRLSIFWPAPKWSFIDRVYKYDETSKYYDCTVVQVRDRPMKQYLLMYDDSLFSNEWLDPMTLRDLGYHFIPHLFIDAEINDRPQLGEFVENKNDGEQTSNFNGDVTTKEQERVSDDDEEL